MMQYGKSSTITQHTTSYSHTSPNEKKKKTETKTVQKQQNQFDRHRIDCLTSAKISSPRPGQSKRNGVITFQFHYALLHKAKLVRF